MWVSLALDDAVERPGEGCGAACAVTCFDSAVAAFFCFVSFQHAREKPSGVSGHVWGTPLQASHVGSLL